MPLYLLSFKLFNQLKMSLPAVIYSYHRHQLISGCHLCRHSLFIHLVTAGIQAVIPIPFKEIQEPFCIFLSQSSYFSLLQSCQLLKKHPYVPIVQKFTCWSDIILLSKFPYQYPEKMQGCK